MFERIAARIDGGDKRIARHLTRRADVARDARRYTEAAALYEEALLLRPDRRDLHVQAGHMRKEAGALEAAHRHYLTAWRMAPDDADLAMQLGHFYKVAGKPREAEAAYLRALELRPGWDAVERELAAMGRGTGGVAVPLAPLAPGQDPATVALEAEAEALRIAAHENGLVPALAPRPLGSLLHQHAQTVEIRRLGRREETPWGLTRTLRGVEAVRGFCVSAVPIVELQLLLDGLVIHRGPVKGGYVLKFEEAKEQIRKYVFNHWLDFTDHAQGRHAVEVRLIDAEGGHRAFHDHCVIAPALAEADYPDSDALVTLDRADARSPEEQIRARPSMVRDARRALFPDGVRNVLVMRTDQLGDMVASIPAVRRLRALLPEAKLVGLLTGANAELARTLNLFDEVLIADFPDDWTERKRVMPLEVQAELKTTLAPYAFDIAIDLAQSNVSRDLLRLAGAKFTFGTGGQRRPWISGDMVFNTHDRLDSMDTTPHSTKVLGLVEALGTLLSAHAPIIRREDLPRSLLDRHGIGSEDRFAVLHAGARVEFSRWPHFPHLARLMLEQTDLKIVMISEDAGVRAALPTALHAHPRFQLLDRRLSFDEFDAFISYATVVVGNDSGPKHLASLRGTNVVTLFTARINWAEWGQENIGNIISRRVPCAGCAIFHDSEECGKDFTCIADIRTQEVLDAVLRYV